jgi:ATP-binding cassette subfamily B protein
MFDIAKAKEENNSNEIADIDRVDSLAAENIGFRFNGQDYLFKDLSLHVNRGEIIGVIGENGCGKSTIAQLLENNYQPQLGQIVVNGKVNMHTVSLDSWRKLCSHVPQRIHLFNGTVLENLAFEDAASSPERVMEFLFKYGFHTFIDRLPLGPMTVIGEGGVNLSGGQRQIIGLARALYKSPQVLILDESTAAMDQLSEKFVKDLLLRIKKDMAIIYISHNVFSVRKICDRIYTVEKGAISVSGNHQTLMSSDNMYSRYWRELLE